LQLIPHLQKITLTEELRKKKEFDQDLINRFVKDLKQFIKTYVLSIQGYDIKQYGSPNELDEINKATSK
jgi:hypothetical protein